MSSHNGSQIENYNIGKELYERGLKFKEKEKEKLEVLKHNLQVDEEEDNTFATPGLLGNMGSMLQPTQSPNLLGSLTGLGQPTTTTPGLLGNIGTMANLANTILD